MKEYNVTLTKGFYLGIHLYEAGTGNTNGLDAMPSEFNDNLNRPVEMVSHDDVQVFLQRLNEHKRCWKYVLPTEAQWEYACRAGTIYSWGNDINSTLANYLVRSGRNHRNWSIRT